MKKAAPTAQQRSVALYRAKMRKAGLRLAQFWVPDTKAPGFVEECRRQSALASAHVEHEHEVLDWIEAAQADLESAEDE
jgi:hypothetical protein